MNPAISEVELSAGWIEYDDTGGDGPVVLLLHGVLMSNTAWRHVVPALTGRFRCVVPTLPLGAHRRPMRPDADLTLAGMARLLDEFLETLDLDDVTLVQNDWGPAQPWLGQGLGKRLSRLVITSSEAFDNYPPAIARPLGWSTRIPGGLAILMRALQWRAVQRAPGSWGWMSKRPVPADVIGAWMRPAHRDPAVRRDLATYVVSVPPRATLSTWAERMGEFAGPVLVVWAAEDKVMPVAHARRLGELFSDCRVVTIDDSYTLLAEDRPDQLTATLLDFLQSTDAAHGR